MEYNQRIYYSGTTVGIGESAFSDAFQLDVYGRIRSDYNFDGFAGFTAYNRNGGTNAYSYVEVINNIYGQCKLFINSTGRITDGGANNASLINYAGDMRIGTINDHNNLYLNSSTNNIGIGTISPVQKLDVNGSINF
ncbi:MAG: hypothetical protein ACK56F_17215, partial [bacterium]